MLEEAKDVRSCLNFILLLFLAKVMGTIVREIQP